MPYRQNFSLMQSHRRGMDHVEREMTRIGLEIEKAASKYLDQHKINVDGDVKKQLYHEVNEIVSGLILKAGSRAQHAPFVHFGTRPHRPPFMPIREWVVKKLAPDPKEIDSIAWAIVHKITKLGTSSGPSGKNAGRRGPNPMPFLDEGFEAAASKFVDRTLAAYMRGFSGRA